MPDPRTKTPASPVTNDGSPDKRFGPKGPARQLATLHTPHVTRAVRRNLAAVIREGLDPEEVREWLMACWLDGAMPPKPTRRRKANEHEEPPQHTPLTFAERSRALEILLLRGFGQPTSHVTLEAEVRALVQVDDATTRKRLEDMDPRKRAELARVLREVLGRPGADAPAPIDAQSREVTAGLVRAEPTDGMLPAPAAPTESADW